MLRTNAWSKRAFSAAGNSGRSNISGDLLTSASMGYSGKEVPKTHAQHLAALCKLNLFDDARVEMSLDRIIKTHFCTKKPYERAEDEVEFNPFSLDPQQIGMGQVLTSSVMHAVTMARLVRELTKIKDKDQLSMIDVGCGTGYSTLLYADLASRILNRPFQMVGTDISHHFIEHSLVQKAKYPIDKCNLQFLEHDFLGDVLGANSSLWTEQFDICTFGFEITLDLLHAKQSMFKPDARLIVPISREDFDREQDFQVLHYRGRDDFYVEENIMRTSFAPRIDKARTSDESLDIDYFNNMQKLSKLQMLEERVKSLEADFKVHVDSNSSIKLAELMKNPDVKATLDELRIVKKKVQGLKYAIEDSVAEAKEAEEDNAKGRAALAAKDREAKDAAGN